jgi:acetylornithine/succinyldiaminopimelate/putrescine aminotransferase
MSSKPNQEDVFYRTLRKRFPTVDHGEDIYPYDADGKRYIDGSGAAAVVSIGHGVREITEAMVKQLADPWDWLSWRRKLWAGGRTGEVCDGETHHHGSHNRK